MATTKIFTITYTVNNRQIDYKGSTTLQFANKSDRDAQYAIDREKAIKYFNRRHCGYYKGAEVPGEIIELKSLDESLLPFEFRRIECGEAELL